MLHYRRLAKVPSVAGEMHGLSVVVQTLFQTMSRAIPTNDFKELTTHLEDAIEDLEIGVSVMCRNMNMWGENSAPLSADVRVVQDYEENVRTLCNNLLSYYTACKIKAALDTTDSTPRSMKDKIVEEDYA